MSYKQKLVTAVATGFAVVSFSAFASAQNNTTNGSSDSTQKQERRERRGGFGKHGGDEGRGGHRGGGMGMRELRELNLTDAQKQQIKAIMEANRGKGDAPEFQEMRTLSQAKHDGTLTDDQKARLQTLREQMRSNMEQTHQQVLAVLTADQRAQLEKLQTERREKMQERRQMRRDGQNGDAPKSVDN